MGDLRRLNALDAPEEKRFQGRSLVDDDMIGDWRGWKQISYFSSARARKGNEVAKVPGMLKANGNIKSEDSVSDWSQCC